MRLQYVDRDSFITRKDFDSVIKLLDPCQEAARKLQEMLWSMGYATDTSKKLTITELEDMFWETLEGTVAQADNVISGWFNQVDITMMGKYPFKKG